MKSPKPKMTQMKLVMPRFETKVVKSFEEASKIYCARRDKSGEGASTFETASIVDENEQEIGRVSYNGRVWPPCDWHVDLKPLWDNWV